jgi:molybdate transport repressor ModE-like protein
MDTELVRSFLAVARSGSFTAAARDLGYVQSTVTGHVAALERALGTRLLDRLPGGSVLTDAGRQVLPRAQELLDAEARLAEAAAPAGAPATATVRVAAPESVCAYRLPALIAVLRDRAPGVRIAPTPAATGAALEAVRRAEADVAVVLEPDLRVTDLAARAVGTEPLALVAAPGFPRRRTWEQLAEHEALLLEEGCSYSDEAVRRLAAAGQPAGRRSHFGSIEAVRQCVAAGLGWTVLPRVAVAAELDAGALVPVTGAPVERPRAYVVHHPGRTPGRAALQVREELAALWRR